ncbi:UDP-glucose dehydrogenase family protein [Legionella dresdenensis]|uniref:UDP-glucose 6-dehydrogenase n=1 Tax=Legionella dresdenensis TaxID=450200 RepID=A0ABV8CC49_9GAMM
MNIAVYGAGYVGLVSAACLASLGHQVICFDINTNLIAGLQNGICPIHEDGLPQLLREQIDAGRLLFSGNPECALANRNIHIIATGTPPLADGSADLSQVMSVAEFIAENTTGSACVIVKSTVPPGTGSQIEALMKAKNPALEVASNPEFLREGTAVKDFLQADRIVIGGNQAALACLADMYQPLTSRGIPLIAMSQRSAELTKYAANAMLACKISYINQISQLAEHYGADIDEIRAGMALDFRIGPHFLQAGIGYGGSCFPKDIKAITRTADSAGIDSTLFQAIDAVNNRQKQWLFHQMTRHFNHQLAGLRVGVWGLSFKPGTDDLREASSLVAINALLTAGAQLYVYDPAAMAAMRKLFPDNSHIVWCDSAEEVLECNLDALIIATEWPQFQQFPLHDMQYKLKNAPIFDGRNCFNLADVRAAKLACYYSVGRPVIKKESGHAS